MKKSIYEYYTDSGANIGVRILHGQTFFFESAADAEQKARHLKTYVYQVFDRAGRHCGYGVPK